MTKRINYFLIIFIALIACFGTLFILNKFLSPVISSKPSPVPAHEFIVRAAIPYWDQKNAAESFKKNVETIDQVSLFWYFLSDEGTIQKYKDAVEDTSLINFAQENDVKTTIVITNLPEESGTTWDSDRVENVLADTTKRGQHIEDIVALAQRLEVDGVTIDYEEVAQSQRANFSAFISELALELHQKNKYLSIALHPKRKEDARYAFQDWKTLATSADQLYIMAYGEHWDDGNPGPIASMSWLEEIIHYTQSLRVPMEKFLLGIPLYGYDWNTDSDDTADGLTYTDVQNVFKKQDVASLWDGQAGAPYFSYESDGDDHEVWYENAQSVGEKINLARNSGFGGVTFWRLGGEDQEIWELLK